MWLLNSSIGKKLIMSISGLFLVLFLLFHLSMNVAAVFSGEAYNMVCSLLGSNWYAVAATLVLAAGVVIHFVYAIILPCKTVRHVVTTVTLSTLVRKAWNGHLRTCSFWA